MPTKRTKTVKTTKLPKPVKPLERFKMDFDFGCGHSYSSNIEMDAFMWSGTKPPVAWVSITLFDDSSAPPANVTVTSPEELEKMAGWLVKAAAWMRKSNKG